MRIRIAAALLAIATAVALPMAISTPAQAFSSFPACQAHLPLSASFPSVTVMICIEEDHTSKGLQIRRALLWVANSGTTSVYIHSATASIQTLGSTKTCNFQGFLEPGDPIFECLSPWSYDFGLVLPDEAVGTIRYIYPAPLETRTFFSGQA